MVIFLASSFTALDALPMLNRYMTYSISIYTGSVIFLNSGFISESFLTSFLKLLPSTFSISYIVSTSVLENSTGYTPTRSVLKKSICSALSFLSLVIQSNLKRFNFSSKSLSAFISRLSSNCINFIFIHPFLNRFII